MVGVVVFDIKAGHEAGMGNDPTPLVCIRLRPRFISAATLEVWVWRVREKYDNGIHDAWDFPMLHDMFEQGRLSHHPLRSSPLSCYKMLVSGHLHSRPSNGRSPAKPFSHML